MVLCLLKGLGDGADAGDALRVTVCSFSLQLPITHPTFDAS